MKIKTDWWMLDEVRRAAGPETYHTPEDTDCRVTANVGDLMAAAMAAAGAFALVMGGATACETDYLAAQGATFPATVTREQMEAFNAATMKPIMDEADEFCRYRRIAEFFGRRAV